jgi:hypothetical protein
MALNNDDLFLVNQGGVSKKLTYEKLKENIDADGIAGVSKIVAGEDIIIDPAAGTGEVTINAAPGGRLVAWGEFDKSTGTLSSSYNVASIARGSNQPLGDWVITFNEELPDHYAVISSANDNSYITANAYGRQTTSVSIFTFHTGVEEYQDRNFSFCCFAGGD